MLRRIDRLEAIQQRTSQLVAATDSAVTLRPSPEAIGTGVRSRDTSESIDPHYDANGWLMPVISRRDDVPQYALTDEHGRILQFVDPAPSVNLYRYLRKQVGVYGRRGYMTEFDKPLVTAQRVVELDRHRR